MTSATNAHLNFRQSQIIEALRRTGYVSIEQLAKDHQVTQQTIRRDINKLCDLGLMERFHGGAVASSQAQNIGHEVRQRLLPDNKAAIAATLVSQIQDGCSLFLDVGTTMTAVAQALRNRANLRIITNNLEAARMLAARDDFEVIVTGGVARQLDGAAVGAEAVETVGRYQPDYALIGTSGISRDGHLLDFNLDKVRVTEMMIKRAKTVFLGADYTKFDRRAMIRSVELERVNLLVTDVPLPPWLAELTVKSECRSLVAEGDFEMEDEA